MRRNIRKQFGGQYEAFKQSKFQNRPQHWPMEARAGEKIQIEAHQTYQELLELGREFRSSVRDVEVSNEQNELQATKGSN